MKVKNTHNRGQFNGMLSPEFSGHYHASISTNHLAYS